jgi:hypothetical protein
VTAEAAICRASSSANKTARKKKSQSGTQN